jgi:hypothetical protein
MIKNMVRSFVDNDLAIDLGTANTLIYAKGEVSSLMSLQLLLFKTFKALVGPNLEKPFWP